MIRGPAKPYGAMNLTIVADENIPAVGQYLGALGRVVHVNGRTLTREQLTGVDILLVRSVTRVDETLLAGSTVRFVGTATSGFDHIDREYLARSDIGFAHAPGANANSVVEYVLAAIAATGDTLEKLLDGGSVGIVGYGHIGKALAARLDALGIRCRVYDPWLDQVEIACASDLDTVLGCDVVSLHPELCTKQPWPSHHLLGPGELRRMRPGALLINASRGSVVDNASLLARLDSACEPLAVLDVWEAEPDIDIALLARVALGTAHIAGYSLDGKILATRMLRDAVMAYWRQTAPAEIPAASHAVADTSAAAPPIRVPDELSGVGLVRYLLQSRYDIRLDDALLRAAVAGDAGTAGIGNAFDRLRKSYRDRRELAGSVVEGSALSPADVAWVRALGCTPVIRGKSE